MNKLFVILFLSLFVTGCATTSVSDVEQQQQRTGNIAIVQNQPAPDLGGYSFERQVLIDTYIARNNTVSTFSYLMTFDGKLIEICPSVGYPIPYATQLTNPEKIDSVHIDGMGYEVGTLPNAEPNSLYTPSSAAATLVQCVNPDGSVSPVYIEQDVMAFPFEVASDIQLQRTGTPSFSVKVNH